MSLAVFLNRNYFIFEDGSRFIAQLLYGIVAMVVIWRCGTQLASASEVKQRRQRLVLGWVTVQRRPFNHRVNQAFHPSVGR